MLGTRTYLQTILQTKALKTWLVHTNYAQNKFGFKEQKIQFVRKWTYFKIPKPLADSQTVSPPDYDTGESVVP
jgi:hypothetical protein